MSRIVSDRVVEGYGEVFRSYEIHDLEYFEYQWSKSIKFSIAPEKVDYTNITDYGTLPHRDEMQTSINYYLNPENCVTAFWQLTTYNYEPESINQLQQDGTWQQAQHVKTFDKTKLRLVNYFKAYPGDAYILNVKHIHSVEKPNLGTKREFLRWSWFNYDITEILKSIQLP